MIRKVAVIMGSDSDWPVVKGACAQLKALTDNGRSLTGTLGIGHTRWATHGEPNDINSHPHLRFGQKATGIPTISAAELQVC